MRPRAVGGGVAALVLVGCLAACTPATVTGATGRASSAASSMTDSVLAPATPTAVVADSSGLVPAQYALCDEGAAILRYLATGNNGGDPGMDQVFASYVGVPAPQARALADKWITACDQQYAAQAAAASSSSAAAQAEAAYQASASASRAAASASEAALAAEQQRSCAAIGGQSDGSRCQSASSGNAANSPYFPCSAVYVEFTENGTIDQTSLQDVNTDHPGCFR